MMGRFDGLRRTAGSAVGWAGEQLQGGHHFGASLWGNTMAQLSLSTHRSLGPCDQQKKCVFPFTAVTLCPLRSTCEKVMQRH